MNKKVPHSVIIKHLYSNMHYGCEYSFDDLEGYYIDLIILTEWALGVSALSQKTVRNIINEWVSIDDRVGKIGRGADARFYKVAPPVMTVQDHLEGLFKHFKEWVNKWK